ncbi:MAG TPA: DUF1800 domain-containing protein [Abditibacteriaceae bacterium]
MNRLAFGARPGDVEHVRRIGLQRWIAQQIQPVGIDDAAVEQKLSRLRTLQYSSQQLGLAYAADTLFRRQMAVERRERQLQRGAMNDAAAPLAAPMQEAMPLSGAAPLPGKRDTTPPGMLPQGMLPQGMTPQQQRVMEEARREGMSQGIAAQVVGELVTAKLVRAVESKRQLHEVMVDFWSNHFNLDVKKGPVRTYKVADEREVIRPHIWGKFRDLLGASAKSPAMLFYLDNVRSTRPMETRPLVSGGARRALRARQNQSALSQSALSQNAMPQNAATGDAMMPAMLEAEADIAPAMRGGINENYARELMELHTMGVAGGYTQKDVQEVARCFTGWSISRQTGEFQFRRFAHDNGEKVVLGQRIAPGGFMQDGERVLDILATHSSTARFLATKVSTRLVSDQPPAALVERAAQAFLKSDGDLRVLVETVVQSPEFWSADSYRAKIKSPFEYAVSAVRALGGTVLVPDATRPAGRSTLIAVGTTSINPNAGAQRNARAARSLAHEIAAMGQPLYSFQAPTGYPEKSQSWVSAGALVSRLNFALSLTSGRVYNARLTPQTLVAGLSGDDRQATLDRLLGQLVGSDVSTATRQTLQKAVAPNAPIDVARWSALILGSPEFQRR